MDGRVAGVIWRGGWRGGRGSLHEAVLFGVGS